MKTTSKNPIIYLFAMALMFIFSACQDVSAPPADQTSDQVDDTQVTTGDDLDQGDDLNQGDSNLTDTTIVETGDVVFICQVPNQIEPENPREAFMRCDEETLLANQPSYICPFDHDGVYYYDGCLRDEYFELVVNNPDYELPVYEIWYNPRATVEPEVEDLKHLYICQVPDLGEAFTLCEEETLLANQPSYICPFDHDGVYFYDGCTKERYQELVINNPDYEFPETKYWYNP